VLHISPESDIGGGLALVQIGDMVTLDVQKRLIKMEVDDNELQKRQRNWCP
tara:strand:+ start:1107 stop:1259 length:153 start_codon:yes stop_codon:yes gene_type:complete